MASSSTKYRWGRCWLRCCFACQNPVIYEEASDSAATRVAWAGRMKEVDRFQKRRLARFSFFKFNSLWTGVHIESTTGRRRTGWMPSILFTSTVWSHHMAYLSQARYYLHFNDSRTDWESGRKRLETRDSDCHGRPYRSNSAQYIE